MKTLIVLLMATSAINAFFIGERSREEFADALHKLFLNMHSGSPGLKYPPSLGMTEIEKIRSRYESLSFDEQEKLKNYLFGVKFPKPMPASLLERVELSEEHSRDHRRREKWEAMTSEEREEFIKNHRAEHETLRRQPRSVPIAPLPEIDSEKPTRPAPPVRSPRSFQAIRPLPEPIDRPSRPIMNPRRQVVTDENEDQYAEIIKILEQLTPEQRAVYFQEVFPNGMPIRPIGVAPAGQKLQPIEAEDTSSENVVGEYVPIVQSSATDNGRTRIVDPWTRERPAPQDTNNRAPRPRPRQIQSIFPLDFQPIFPIKSQPIFPLPGR